MKNIEISYPQLEAKSLMKETISKDIEILLLPEVFVLFLNMKK